MKTYTYWLHRLIARILVMFLAVSFAEAADTPRQQTLLSQHIQGGDAVQERSHTTDHEIYAPDRNLTSPRILPASPVLFRQHTIALIQQSGTDIPITEQPKSSTSIPLGTAAAPYEKPFGVAVSRPAGAAIAPAKQKRTRSILIKVGALLGACVAVGTVVALSAASPSRPH